MVDVQDFLEAIKQEPVNTITTYSAVVSHVDDQGTVWVYIAGSDEETPTSTISTEVESGDDVNVEWRNNRLYIAGNVSNPSAGALRVDAIEETADRANEVAVFASIDAAEANSQAKATNQYFWFTSTDIGAGAGAHITEKPHTEFLDDPTNGGGNVLIDSDSVDIRDGTDTLASFGANGVTLYNADGRKVGTFVEDKIHLGMQTINVGNVEISQGGMIVGTIANYAPRVFKRNGEVGIVLTTKGSYVEYQTTNPRLDSNFSFTLPYTPTSGSDIVIYYQKGSTTSNIEGLRFVGGTADTLDFFLDGGKIGSVDYDGDKTFAYTKEGIFSTTTHLTYVSYYAFSSAGNTNDYAGSFVKIGNKDWGRPSTARTLTVGDYLNADSMYQFAIGKYNDNKSTNAFEIGNGTADNARSNSFEIGVDGNITVEGHSSPIGAYFGYASTDTIASGTSFVDTGISMNLPKGRYIVDAYAGFGGNTTGFRGIRISVSDDGSTTDVTTLSSQIQPALSNANWTNRLHTSAIIVSDNSDVVAKVQVLQNSGSSLSVTTQARWIRIR